MTEALSLVLLVGADGDAPQGALLGSESTPLAALLDRPGVTVTVSFVSLGVDRDFPGAAQHVRLGEAGKSVADRLLGAIGAYALRARFEGFPIGRLLNTLGPVDPGRVFWRTLTRTPAAMSLLHRADVVIATDLETTKAAWIAVHRGWVAEAFYDHRAVARALQPRGLS